MTHQQAMDRRAAERYLLDEMPELERFAFEAHYFECAECAESVRMGGLMEEGVREGALSSTGRSMPALADTPPAAPPVPAAHSPALTQRRAWLPWAVAASLAVGLGYQSLQVVQRPGQPDAPRVLAPTALRAATRGADTTVVRATSGDLSFALDLPGIPVDTRLTYDLRTADGTSVASGTAVAPTPGIPLLLLMPGSSAHGAGSYTLSIRAADEPESLPVDYRFTITEG